MGLLTQSLDAVMMPFLPPKPPFPPGSLLERAYDPKDERVWAFHARAKYLLEGLRPLHLFQATATGLLLEGNRVVGVRTWEGPRPGGEGGARGGELPRGEAFPGRGGGGGGKAFRGELPRPPGGPFALGLPLRGTGGEVPETPSTPGYRVRYLAFHPEEWEEKTFRLKRLEGLYAVGLCVREGDYARMSEEGKRLAEHLLHELG